MLLPDLGRSIDNLLLHKLRTLLTMLGMIFGVAAVLSMLSIGAGAQQQVMAFIEGLGVRNLIVEARETTECQAIPEDPAAVAGPHVPGPARASRRRCPGIDVVDAAQAVHADARWCRSRRGEMPVVYGVEPNYLQIAGAARRPSGRFFTDDEAARAAAVCVLGEAARQALFGGADPLGQLRQGRRAVVPGDRRRRRRRRSAQGDVGRRAGAGSQQPDLRADHRRHPPARRQLLAVPRRDRRALRAAEAPTPTSPSAASIVRGILDSSHRGATDYSLIVPAELLAEQQRTKRIFDIVMVALASISLLVGGIGIMNIMLASVLERTPEIGLRRALGATRVDVIRQFVLETTLLAVGGGVLGLLLGVALSRVIASFAGWSTIVSRAARCRSRSSSRCVVGLVSGVYPAMKASQLDPVQALHYE